MDECFNPPRSLYLALIYGNIAFSTVSCGLSIFAPLKPVLKQMGPCYGISSDPIG